MHPVLADIYIRGVVCLIADSIRTWKLLLWTLPMALACWFMPHSVLCRRTHPNASSIWNQLIPKGAETQVSSAWLKTCSCQPYEHPLEPLTFVRCAVHHGKFRGSHRKEHCRPCTFPGNNGTQWKFLQTFSQSSIYSNPEWVNFARSPLRETS